MIDATQRLDVLSPADKARLEEIRQARLLLDGLHRQYFLDESAFQLRPRTEFAFQRIRKANGFEDFLYITDNLIEVGASQSADMLFGESPVITSDSAVHHDRLTALAERSALQQVLQSSAVDASVEAEAFLESLIWDEQTYIQQVDAAAMFPLGPVRPDGQHDAYLRREIQQVDDKTSLLLERTYRRGSVERHLFEVVDGKKTVEKPLEQWPEFAAGVPGGNGAIQNTGIPWNTMTWIPNRLVRRKPASDLTPSIRQMQDAVNAKTSQLACVLLKHADPKLLLPAEAADPSGQVPLQHGVYFMRDGGFEPKYLTWESELNAAREDRTFAVQHMFAQMQTSMVLAGMDDGKAAEAYPTMRIRSLPAVNKANRRSLFWKAGVTTALMTASMLDQTIIGSRYDLGTISCRLRGGIPIDPAEQATRLATERAAGFCSIRRALTETLEDEAAVDKEMAELEEEAKNATPNILLQTEQAPGDQSSVNSEQMPPEGGTPNMGRMPMPPQAQQAQQAQEAQ